jgi:hypothetical protein
MPFNEKWAIEFEKLTVGKAGLPPLFLSKLNDPIAISGYA